MMVNGPWRLLASPTAVNSEVTPTPNPGRATAPLRNAQHVIRFGEEISGVGTKRNGALGSPNAVTAMLGAASMASGVEAVAVGRDLSEFYSAEYPRLVGVLTLYCGDGELANDLAQEAMARACRDWSKVSGLDSPQAWVYRVGMNLAHSWFRRSFTGRRAMASAQGEPTAGDDDVTTRLAVRAEIVRLPRRQRAALVLRYFVDLPVAEVAVLMRCSEGTVRALTSQALSGLRTAFPNLFAEVPR